MPWVVRTHVDEIYQAISRRWQGFNRCSTPSGTPRGLRSAVRRHRDQRPPGPARRLPSQHVKASTLNLTSGTPDRLSLIARSARPTRPPPSTTCSAVARSPRHPPGTRACDTAADDHLAPPSSSAGSTTLLRHGLQPITVIAVRPARSRPPSSPQPRTRAWSSARPPPRPRRRAQVRMGVSGYDALFGAAILRPATEELVRAETQAALAVRPARPGPAERDWRAGRPRPRPAARAVALDRQHGPGRRDGVPADPCSSRPSVRATAGVEEALVGHVHAMLDARGVDTTLLPLRS